MTARSSDEQRPTDAENAAPDHDDRNWQALAEPTGRSPFLWRAMRWVAVLATVTVLVAVVIHVARLAMRAG